MNALTRSAVLLIAGLLLALTATDASALQLRRDGDRATPFRADSSQSVSRYGSATGTSSARVSRAADGFDWADAVIGLGAGLAVASTAGAVLIARRRGPQPA